MDDKCKSDCKNFTHEDTKHINQYVPYQQLFIDHQYGIKLEYYEQKYDTGAGGLNSFLILEEAKEILIQQLYLNKMKDRHNSGFSPFDFQNLQFQQKQILNKRKHQNSETFRQHHEVQQQSIGPNIMTQSHHYLDHGSLLNTGVIGILNTMNDHFDSLGMHKTVENHIKTCNEGQCFNITGNMYLFCRTKINMK